jgi:hypothetical protein
MDGKSLYRGKRYFKKIGEGTDKLMFLELDFHELELLDKWVDDFKDISG